MTAQDTSRPVGFCGRGAMGAPMAANLVRATNLIGFGALLAVAEGIALVDEAGGDVERALGIFLR